jgi:23S rRNA (guanosine2251-2'-O)-methyltransferase
LKHPNQKPSHPSDNDHEPKRNTMLIGIRPLIEAIHAGKEIEKVFIQQGLRGDLIAELRPLLSSHDIPAQQVPLEKLNRISRKNHQGVIAFVSPVTFGNLENIVAQLFDDGKNHTLLMLDGVTDVRNFGSICRSAECMGVQAVIIPQKGSAQINEEAIKTSAGALYNIPVCRVKSISSAVAYLQQSGVRVIACSEKTRADIDEVDLSVPTCIVMGSEENGISNDVIRKADYITRIPMAGKTSSLNVAVAAGIILYELGRQRKSMK